MEVKVQRIKEKDYERIFVMTDLHGRYDLFLKMIEKINLSKKDLLIVTGDSCDRGNGSYSLYKWYVQKINENYNVIHLIGNHEDMMYKAQTIKRYKENWLWNGGEATIKSFFENYAEEEKEPRKNTGEENSKSGNKETGESRIEEFEEYFLKDKIFEERWLFDFIQKMPHIIEGEKYLFVHAGIDFTKSLERQEERYLIWTRDDWYTKNDTGKTVFYGHTPQEEITVRNNCVNLDSGAVMTGVMNCMEVRGNKLYRLKNGEISEENFEIGKEATGILKWIKKLFRK